MKQLRAMLFQHQHEWYISPLNTFEKLIPFSQPKTDKNILFIRDQDRSIPWVELKRCNIPSPTYSLILLINVKIKGEHETLAIGTDSPPKIIDINENNVRWLNDEQLLVYVQQPESLTAKILDENILTNS